MNTTKSKRKVSKPPPSPEQITLDFDIFNLPTSQHKAGLSGLLLQIEAMRAREQPAHNVPAVIEQTRTTARIEFTERSLQGMLDDCYAASLVEVAVASKWKGAEPKREIPPSLDNPGRRFVYDVVQPTGEFLVRHLESPETNPWLKLWRDMLWKIPRGIPTTRGPFMERANGPHCSLGTKVWKSLCDFESDRKKGRWRTEPISSALLLGAQDSTAEGVPFEGRADENLLLHFWTNCCVTYVPRSIDDEGNIETGGYVLAIPEVADLREFLDEFPELLATLTLNRKGYLPAEAVLDIPIQAGLEFLRSLHRLAADKQTDAQWAPCCSAIELFQCEKRGNAVKLLGHERVTDAPGLVGRYERIRSTYRNPIFRAACLRSLLRDEPWYAGMGAEFAKRPPEFFLESEDTPQWIPRFALDARGKFKAIQEDCKYMEPLNINEPDRLAVVVNRLVRTYCDGCAESKTGLHVEDFPKVKAEGKTRRVYPDQFREAQAGVCSDAFFAARSRHDRDFCEWFAGSICAVGQYLPMADYQFLTDCLRRQPDRNANGATPPSWEDVKMLTLVSLSAHAHVVRKRTSEKTTNH